MRLSAAIFLLPMITLAADVVPFSVRSISPVGLGYVELVWPGKIEVNKEVLDYDGTKYIRADNVGTLTGIHGSTKGCMLAYASEGYTENISVTEQSCDEVLEILEEAK